METTTERVEIAAERTVELGVELESIASAANAAQGLWFRLSALGERTRATAHIAVDRVANYSVAPWIGPDPDLLEQRVDDTVTGGATLAEAETEARERLEEIRETLFDAERTSRGVEAEHLTAARVIADRRGGVVHFISAEESLHTRLEAVETEAARFAERANETDERRIDVTEAVENAAQELAEAEFEGPELQSAYEQVNREVELASTRLKGLHSDERDLKRSVSSLSARIETLETARIVVANDSTAWLRGRHELGVLSEVTDIDAGWEKAFTAALDAATEALVGEGNGDSLIDGLVATGKDSVVVINSADASDFWRLDITLPAQASWLLDHVTMPIRLSGSLTSLLVDIMTCDDEHVARELISQDTRLRIVDRDGVLHSSGWVADGAGGTASGVKIAADIAKTREELIEAQVCLSDLSGVPPGAQVEEKGRRTDTAAACTVLHEHQSRMKVLTDAQTRTTVQLSGVVHNAERTEQRGAKAADRVTKLQKELAKIADRLAHANRDPEEGELSTSERDRASETLTTVRAIETEACLSLRTVEERLSSVWGKAEWLHRRAASERVTKAHHKRAQMARVVQRELAEVVAELAKDLHAKVNVSLVWAEVGRDDAETQKKMVLQALSAARVEADTAQHKLAQLTDSVHQGDIARAQAQVRVTETAEHIVGQLGLSVDDLLVDSASDESSDCAAVTKQLKQAKKGLRVLGRVNSLASEEYKAIEECYSFLFA